MKPILRKIKKIRENNNAQWMRLVAISLECDEIKKHVNDILKNIAMNDVRIQKEMKKLTKLA